MIIIKGMSVLAPFRQHVPYFHFPIHGVYTIRFVLRYCLYRFNLILR